MAALTAAQTLRENTGDQASRPVLNGVKIWKGGMVGVTAAGYARPFAATDQFAGHALETVDNTDGAAGAVRVITKRGRYALTVPSFDSAAVANIGDDVGTTSDNHADMTLTSTNKVGVVSDVNDNGVTVMFQTDDAE